MAEYSRLAKGKFTSTGGAQVINLPFQPDYVEFINYTASATPANHGIPSAWWDSNMGQGFAVIDLFNATPVMTSDTVDVNGIHFVVVFPVTVKADELSNGVPVVKPPAIAGGHLPELHSIKVIVDRAIGEVVRIGPHHIHRHHEPLPLAADDPSNPVASVLAADADAACIVAANVVALD